MPASMHYSKKEPAVGNEGGPSAPAAAGIFPSSSSNIASAGTGEGDAESGLLELPKDCIVRVLLFLSALDTCCVARVCRVLRAVGDSDEVWLPRLPLNPVINPPSLSKKDLYFRLRARMLRKDLSLPYWLDPMTGQGCFVKSARDLTIIWGNNPSYWNWKPQPDSWFPDSACLRTVCWFEVCGEFESIFLPGAYTLSFRISFTDQLRGWEVAPVKISLSTSNGQHVESQRLFSGESTPQDYKVAPLRSSRGESAWMELDAGEFHVEREMRVKLQVRMLGMNGTWWKAGVILDCLKIQSSSALSRELYV